MRSARVALSCLLFTTLACGGETEEQRDLGSAGSSSGGSAHSGQGGVSSGGASSGGASSGGVSSGGVGAGGTNAAGASGGGSSGAGGSAGECPGLVCSGECVDPLTDAENCGACGSACLPGQVCSVGYCICPCPAGMTQCGKNQCLCVDTLTDPQHCGGCEQTCTPTEICAAGQCVFV